MEKKSALGIILTLLLASMPSLALDIQPVKATGTIYIRPDGSVDPSTASIQRDGGTYTFTDNVYDSIVVEKDDIVIDGIGYIVQGTGSGTGITLSGRTNVTVKNTKIAGFWHGIFLSQSSDNSIGGNIMTNNWGDIVLSQSSNYNIISGNNIGEGFIEESLGNTISGNNITRWINLGISDNNSISGNTIAGGIGLAFSFNNTISGNNITGYIGLTLAEDNTISGNNITGGIGGVDNCSHNTISGNNITGGIGFGRVCSFNVISENNITGGGSISLMWAASYNTICGNVISNSGGSGIAIIPDGGPNVNNKIIGNKITNSSSDGIYLDGCINNTLSENYITNNGGCGIILYHEYFFGEMPASDSNSISGNTIAGNAEDGILLYGSSGNTIFGNNVTNNDSGLVLNWIPPYYYPHNPFYSENNIISGNDITVNKQYGIHLLNASNNSIYHNSFVDNAKQVYNENSTNVWDDGYPSGGNYWSDYSSVDLCYGPSQNLPGPDGIWDHPYIIDPNNADRYPLVKAYPIIPSIIDASPDSVSLRSLRIFFTFYIELPHGYDVQNIDVSTIRLNNIVKPEPRPIRIGDHDGNGIPDLMVKFNGAKVKPLLHVGMNTLTVSGMVNSRPFMGSDTIKVVR